MAVNAQHLELVRAAQQVVLHAHAPYSNFRVGAALRTESGKVFVGCNVENASYGATICAERSAVSQMVAAGERAISSLAIYVEADAVPMPCGMCRQVLAEFAEDLIVIVANPSYHEFLSLAELLPHRFRFSGPGPR